MNFRGKVCKASCLVVFLAACSGNESSGPVQGGNSSVVHTGGAGSGETGGATSTAAGGTLSASTGGTVSAPSGGTESNSTGGSNATGGSLASGGTTSTGGSGGKASGGSTTIGGSGTRQTGGAAPTGGSGVLATGGTAVVGGSSAGGGTSSTGLGGKGVGGGVIGGTTAAGGTSAAGGSSNTAPQHWVGTWTAAPYVDTNSNNAPPIPLSNSVVRQVAHVSLGGSQIRVQFSNLFGNGSLTINSAHIALCKASPKVDSTIDTATDKALAFSGKSSVTVPQGQEVWSDPIDFTVANQGNISITTAFGSVPSTLTQHSGSRTTSYFQANSTNVSAANMASAQTKALWFFISGIDVMADASAKGIVAIGDSITDGRGTTTDGNNRWTDILAARLQANPATANVSTMNQGIGATNLAGTSSTSAQSRFNRDVLGQSGVKYVVLFHGVNDIGSSNSSFSTLKTAFDDLISRAHSKGLLIYGGTILPFDGNSYYSTAHESVRQQVNTYIKSGAFDGYIDFDAALRDPATPTKLLPTYAQWAEQDWLHPGPAGYQKMGETPDLTLFTR